MENEVWSEISAFLNNLRCGDVSRKSYLHFPELEEAEKIRKVKKANFETEMRKLNAEQRQQIENYLEAVQHLAFMEEERAYCQGYVLFGRHLDYFITNFGFAPRKLANDINTAFTQGTLVEYISPSNDNSMRTTIAHSKR